MFSAIFKGPKVTEDLDECYPLRQDVDVSCASKFRPRKKKRLSEDAWHRAFDSEGRLAGLNSVLDAVCRGGVDPRIRPEVWEFLLGVFGPKSTAAEREALRKSRREMYSNLKVECNLVDPIVGSGIVVDFPRVREDGTDIPVPTNSDNPMLGMLDMSLGRAEGALSLVQDSAQFVNISSFTRGTSMAPERTRGVASTRSDHYEDTRQAVLERAGSEKVRKWRLGLHQIGVDVMRADRTLQFYEDEGNRARLMDVLALYSWFDSEVGYCQGMGDLMSPMVVLFENNADAFWCFERLMHKVRDDFIGTSTSLGVQTEINRLVEVLKIGDAELFLHLDEIGASSLFFTVRPIMTMFRRELSFADALYLWEMQWAWEFNLEEVEKVAAADRAAIRSAARDPVKASSRVTFLEDDEAYSLRKTVEAAQRALSRTQQPPEDASAEAGHANGVLQEEEEGEGEEEGLYDPSGPPVPMSGPLTEREKAAVEIQRKALGGGHHHHLFRKIDEDDAGEKAEAPGAGVPSAAGVATGGQAGNAAAPGQGQGGKPMNAPRRYMSMPRNSITRDTLRSLIGDYRRHAPSRGPGSVVGPGAVGPGAVGPDGKPRITESKSKGIRASIRRRLHKNSTQSRSHPPLALHPSHTPPLGGDVSKRADGKGGLPPIVSNEASEAWQSAMELIETVDAQSGSMTAEALLGRSTRDRHRTMGEHRLTRLNTFCVLAVLLGARADLLDCDGMDDVVDVFNNKAAEMDVKKLVKLAQEAKGHYSLLVM